MGAGAYLLGWALLVIVVGLVGFIACELRAWLLPSWHGAPARLAEIALGVSAVVIVSELLGALGWFRRWPFVLSVVVLAIVTRTVARRRMDACRATATATPVSAESNEPRWERIAATAGAAVVGAQWCGKIAYAYAHGMTHPDTVWYHATYSVEFVQKGHLLVQLDRTDALHAYGAQTSELLHAVLLLIVGRDVLSPVVNVAWAGVALLAAWCVGRRFRAGALCMLGATVAVGLPTIMATHPGQASNDLPTAACVLVALAILAEEELAPAATAIAGLAAGLAFGMKVTSGAPVVVLTVGVIVLAARRRRPRVALLWCGGLLATGSYWVIRNSIVAHNPFPYYTLHLGPLTFTRAPQRHADAVAKYLFNAGTWRGFYLPGLRVALGDVWPLVLGLAFVGSIGVALARRPVLIRLGAVAFVFGFVAYLFTPYTADFGLAFTYNVRYAEPALLGMLTLTPLLLARRSTRARAALAAAFGVAIVVDALAANHERLPAWPTDGRVAAVVGAVAITGLAVGRAHVRAIVPLAIVAAFFIGWPVQRYYEHHRYVAAGLPLDPVNAALQSVHGARVAFFGTDESYPFYGAALTNRVTRPAGAAQSPNPADCRAWIRTLAGDRYIVIAQQVFVFEGPVNATIAADRGVTTIAENANAHLYEVVAPLAGNAC